MKKAKELAIKIPAALGTVIVVFFLTLALDRFVGLFTPEFDVTDNLIFRPNRTVSYDMLEFSFEVKSNNLGFRGPPVHPSSRAQTRLIGIGDSYTLGWGVTSEQTWLRVLERKLQGQGHDIECLNLGQLGGGPREFATMLERALPRLNPDIVLLGMPQRAQILAPASMARPRRVYSFLLDS